VKADVFSASQDDQIFRLVIEGIPINVMNDFVGGESSAFPLLNDHTMERATLTVVLDEPVALLEPAFSLPATIVALQKSSRASRVVEIRCCSTATLAELSLYTHTH
jgi:hypothetical protein